MTVKRLQRMRLKTKQRVEQELEKLAAAKDSGVSLEQAGIDYLFIDEAHAYKNLLTFSNIPGMAIEGSRRASDLHMKLEYLRTRSSRVATLATATPIANSIGEVYTMLRYLRPDLLESAGIRGFDAWASTFGETVTFFEVAPDGSGMRMQARFARFRNAAELLRWFAIAGDFKAAEDLKLPVPELVQRAGDGLRAPEVVVVPPSTQLSAFMREIAERAERIRRRQVRPKVDNMLKISTDGRMAALDLRMVGLLTAEPTKLDLAVERISGTYEKFRDARYHDASGELHPVPGALQLVFADIGTPKAGEWSVYEELRDRLIDKGLPRSAVRFIQEAKDDQAKAKLFAACREGRVAVLVGSTEGMGTGTNVQRRAVALHHLDCPWRPADLAQREGRIVRQGNENPEVQIVRYVTERSFDAYSWQTVARKAEAFNALLRGRLEDVRELEELGDTVLSLNEAKALATGSPLLLEHAQAQTEVTRLERLERSHRHAQEVLKRGLRDNTAEIALLVTNVAALDAALAIDTHGREPDAPFTITVGDRSCDKRGDADERLREVIGACVEQAATQRGQRRRTQIGAIRGFAITVDAEWSTRSATLGLAGVPDSETPLTAEDITRAAITQRLENRLSRMPQLRQQAQFDIQRLEAETGRARAELGRPFRQVDQLDAARERLAALQQEIASSAHAQPDGPALAPDPDRSALDELTARMQAQHALPVRPLPSDQAVQGTLVHVEMGADEQPRAVVAGDQALYILTGFAPDTLSHAMGQTVELDKRDGNVRIATCAAELRVETGVELAR